MAIYTSAKALSRWPINDKSTLTVRPCTLQSTTMIMTYALGADEIECSAIARFITSSQCEFRRWRLPLLAPRLHPVPYVKTAW
jgi:hypothetical protein